MVLPRYIRHYLAAIAMAAGLSACINDVDAPQPVDPTPSPDIYLTLDVNVLGSRAGANNTSRANESYFELPELECEKIRTLRVIIVSQADRSVEANRLVTLNDQGIPLNDNLTFRVVPGDKYIYLFGNESSMPETYQSLLAASTFRTTLPQSVDNGTLDRSGSAPIFDWTAGEGTLRVPMSERWEVNVRQAVTPADRYQTAKLFITRAVSKFSFRLHKSADFVGASSATIDAIAIDYIGSRSFIIPRNTVYSPSKDEPSYNQYEGRFITAFDVPTVNNTAATYVFKFPWTFRPDELIDDQVVTYAPKIYLPETRTPQGGFNVRIRTTDGAFSAPVKLPNLDLLPRNTHVVVDITLGNDHVILVDVKVLPWNSEVYEYDYTTEIGIATDGYLRFDANSYLSLDRATARLVLDYPNPATATFGISTPVGATWDAYLITTAGEQDAIQFRTLDQATGTYNYTTHVSGPMGNTLNNISIVSVLPPGSEPRTARLQVTATLPGGATIPVNILNPNTYGKNEFLTIIQNSQ